jgi:hypothetical protein
MTVSAHFHALSIAAPADSTLEALYASGVPFDRFLADANARRSTWVRNWEASQVPPEVLELARGLDGHWRLLVIAVDGCSDSVNTIPYLARLVALAPQLELRIVSPTAGRAVMEAHRTPDGRAATPTVIILDAQGNEVGAWVERPSVLQQMAIDARAAGTFDRLIAGKQAWYDADAGASTVREVVDLVARAARADARPLPSPPGLR